MSKLFSVTFIFLVIFSIPLQAQNRFFQCKITDHPTIEFTRLSAELKNDNTLVIMAAEQGKEEFHYLQITLVPQKDVTKDRLVPGKYYFSTFQRMLKSSYDYSVQAQFGKIKSSTIIKKYQTTDVTEGYLDIEVINADEIKASFVFVADQRIGNSSPTLRLEGSFNLHKKQENVANTAEPSITPQTEIKEKPIPIIGLFDIHGSLGVNYTKSIKQMPNREFGTDYDFGITFLHLPYTKSLGPGATVELHVDYSRQNFDAINDWKFRRGEIYTRIRPLSSHAAYPISARNVRELLISSLYVDVGYSDAKHFRETPMDVVFNQEHHKSFFWGWGLNVKWREERIGFTGGIGSKRYVIDGRKYKSKCISMGVTYNLIWKE
jgi:hypothetical protein